MLDYLQQMWSLAINRKAQGIVFFGAVYFTFVATGSLVYQFRIAGWPKTRGKLVDARLRKFGAGDIVPSNQDYLTSTEYEYSVAGKNYRGKRLSPWVVVASRNARFVLNKRLEQIAHDEFGGVDVFYNPKSRTRVSSSSPVSSACCSPPRSLSARRSCTGPGFTADASRVVRAIRRQPARTI